MALRITTQLKAQKPGLESPTAWLAVVFSLALGTVLEAAIRPYQGKRTSELALRCATVQIPCP